MKINVIIKDVEEIIFADKNGNIESRPCASLFGGIKVFCSYPDSHKAFSKMAMMSQISETAGYSVMMEEAYSIQECAEMLEDKVFIEIVTNGGKLIGFMEPAKRYAFIENLYVVPDRRGYGIGKTLKNEFSSLVEKYGIDEIRLLSVPSAKNFWEKEGFRTIPGETIFSDVITMKFLLRRAQ